MARTDPRSTPPIPWALLATFVAEPGWPLRDGDGRISVCLWLDSVPMAIQLLVEGAFAREANGNPPHLYRVAVAEERGRHRGRVPCLRKSCAGHTSRRPA